MNKRDITRVYLDDRGRYHWEYDLPMFRNFSILFTVMKVSIFCTAIPIMIVILSLSRGPKDAEFFKASLSIIGFATAVVLALCIVIYFLTAAICRGHYICAFIMDEETISMYQKGSGLRQVVCTKFSDIRSLKFRPSKEEIHVHAFLTWYTVYVNELDFNLVTEHLESRCMGKGTRYL